MNGTVATPQGTRDAEPLDLRAEAAALTQWSPEPSPPPYLPSLSSTSIASTPLWPPLNMTPRSGVFKNSPSGAKFMTSDRLFITRPLIVVVATMWSIEGTKGSAGIC